MKTILLSVGASFCCLLFASNLVFAQGTAFTYQGQLTVGGVPATGSYTMAFSLFATNVGGVALAGPVTNSGIAASNGLFTTTLDFGGGVFSGSNDWLDISVATNGGGTFTELAPRQQITPAPYAIFAPSAGTAASVTGNISISQLPAAVLMNNDTNAVNLTGTFNGNGTGLTNLNATNLTGTIPNSLLSNNVLTVIGQGPFQTNVYSSAGASAVVVPSGATQIIAKLWGAGGGGGLSASGGGGAFVQTTMTVAPGQMFTIVVGQHGDEGDDNAGGIGSGDAEGGSGYGGAAGGGGQGGQASSLFYLTGGSYIMEAVAGAGGGANQYANGGAGGNRGADGVSGSTAATGGYNGTGGSGGSGQDGSGGSGSRYALNATTVGIASLGSAIGSGGSGNSLVLSGGGGGGGYGGGGGGDGDGGGAGGGSYGQIIIDGNGRISGNTSDPNYLGGGNGGGNGGNGHDGLVVLIFGNPPVANVSGAVAATGFYGNGAGLTNLPLPNLNLTNIGGNLPTNYTYYVTGNISGGFGNTPMLIENTNTSASCGPALRVQADGTNTTAGALSVSSQNTSAGSLIAQFGNSNAFVANIAIDGTVNGKVFNGTSDRNAKENFTSLNPETVLDKVSSLPVTEWNYKDNSSQVRHIGPVAQDFHAAFGLNGGDDKHISVLDEGGVALAAIQGLNEKLKERDAQMQSLKAQNDALAKRLDELTRTVESLSQRK